MWPLRSSFAARLLRRGRGVAVAALLALPLVPAAAGAQTAAPVAAGALEAALQEQGRLLADRLRLQREQGRAEAEAQRGAAEIEQLKGEPAGVRRDLQLQERLAQAEARATALSQRAAALRAVDAGLAALRQRVIRLCDGLLGGALTTAARLEVLQVRAAAVDALAGGPERGAALTVPARGGDTADADDPRGLRERADLLRDAADKLKRELARLEERSEELLRRRRLQERLAAVDEDLFTEQAVSRRSGARAERTTGGADSAAPALGPGVTSDPRAPAPTPSVTTALPATSPFASGVDPTTLHALRSAGAEAADPEARLRSLRHAQGELRRMMDQLNRRASLLEQRSATLLQHK